MGINWFEKAKEGYEYGAYTKETLKAWVTRGKITPAQYEEITGEPYQTEQTQSGGEE